ncbi:MAG TPA: substrate-binding domain-containing protein [Bryobacteraceae bacterium]|nr:substrate-binding domain-containing protein [Bryobacteraceae bacterium]
MSKLSIPLLALAIAGGAAAQQPLHVLCSNGVREVIKELQPKCERAIGHPLAIEYGSTTDLVKKIDGGEKFDLAIFTTEAIDRFIQSGKLVAATRADIARCGVGVGIRAGAPKPDISTPEAMKATLLKAKYVSYAADGASRKFVEEMEQKFGIAGEMKAKTILTHGSVEADANVAAGKADLVLTLGSEILPAPGVQLVGPLPAAVQHYINFAAAVSTMAQNADAAKAMIRFLKGPETAPVYRAKGMEER